MTPQCYCPIREGENLHTHLKGDVILALLIPPNSSTSTVVVRLWKGPGTNAGRLEQPERLFTFFEGSCPIGSEGYPRDKAEGQRIYHDAVRVKDSLEFVLYG